MSWPGKLCDFCNAPDCIESFECPPSHVALAGNVHSLRGPWFACALCAGLILGQGWTKLVARIVRAVMASKPDSNPRVAFEIAWACVDTFRTTRGAAA